MQAFQLAEHLAAWRSSSSPAGVSRTPFTWRISNWVWNASSSCLMRELAAGSGQEAAFGSAGQALGFADVEKQAQVGQVVVHGFSGTKPTLSFVNSKISAANLSYPATAIERVRSRTEKLAAKEAR
jgi:hypothetical protein